jgi:uncharacterized protein (TIGR03435 family)
MANCAKWIVDSFQGCVELQSTTRTTGQWTGLNGRFDYEVRFSVTAGRLDSAAAAPPVPDLFRALRDQLGLKLEPVIAPVNILVVDSAEQPTAN